MIFKENLQGPSPKVSSFLIEENKTSATKLIRESKKKKLKTNK